MVFMLLVARLLEIVDSLSLFFFFQAEDGIRDLTVTGVQTCALPIYLSFQTTEQDIRSLFEVHGSVDRVNIVTDRDSGQPRGFGFVEMTNNAEGDRDRKSVV